MSRTIRDVLRRPRIIKYVIFATSSVSLPLRVIDQAKSATRPSSWLVAKVVLRCRWRTHPLSTQRFRITLDTIASRGLTDAFELTAGPFSH